MKRLLAVVAVVSLSLLLPVEVELDDSLWAIGAPDPAICFLLGVSSGGLAVGLWRRERDTRRAAPGHVTRTRSGARRR